jgi:hypothetical protein
MTYRIHQFLQAFGAADRPARTLRSCHLADGRLPGHPMLRSSFASVTLPSGELQSMLLVSSLLWTLQALESVAVSLQLSSESFS